MPRALVTGDRVDRWPRFRFDELVRVVDAGGSDRRQSLLGREGVVEFISPDRNGGGWVITVRFGPRARSGERGSPKERFWESQLESTGLMETDGVRVPLEPSDPAELFLELWIQLFVPIGEEPLEELARRLAAECVELLSGDARIDVSGRVDDDYPDHWLIVLEIRPVGPSRVACEVLAASFDHWQNEWDDGWECEFRWWRKAAPAGQDGWLLPQADSVFLDLLEYSDPTFRPVKRGRNQPADSGGNRQPTEFESQLHGLPPPAGYEP